MFIRRIPGFLLFVAVMAVPSYAQLFGTVRVTAHDPQNLAIPDAKVTIKDKNSHWEETRTTDAEGQALFLAVPVGQYLISINAPGFADVTGKAVEVNSNVV